MSKIHRHQSTARTEIGLVRRMNEDAILASPDHGIWVVADGMGGHDGGDFASQTLVDTIAGQAIGVLPASVREQALCRGIQDAHRKIRSEATIRGRGVIGTTVVALMIIGTKYVVVWAGDSRVYRLRGGSIALLTTDHSAVAPMVLAGKMTWDASEKHMLSNAITRAVGIGVDLEPEIIRGQVQSGDRFLLCSDGLNKYATFDVLQKALGDLPIETISDGLIDIALTGGGRDNISVIVVDID